MSTDTFAKYCNEHFYGKKTKRLPRITLRPVSVSAVQTKVWLLFRMIKKKPEEAPQGRRLEILTFLLANQSCTTSQLYREGTWVILYSKLNKQPLKITVPVLVLHSHVVASKEPLWYRREKGSTLNIALVWNVASLCCNIDIILSCRSDYHERKTAARLIYIAVVHRCRVLMLLCIYPLHATCIAYLPVVADCLN